MTTIDFIRHGEPVGGQCYRGHGVDDPLSESGWRQMWDAVGQAHPWQHIVTSPLQRCEAFAQALGKRHSIPVSVLADLKEVGFGSWEGKTPAELKQTHASEHAAFYLDPVRNRPAGAEDLDLFSARVNGCYQQIVAQHPQQHVLVVAHAGVIRAIVAQQLGAPLGAAYLMQLGNAGLTRLVYNQGQSNLHFFNAQQLPQ